VNQTARFDARFYRRFYVDPRTRVASRAELAARARTIAQLVRHLDIPVRRILDAGCGLGWMRATLLKAFPGATYTGLEVSEHLCKRLGWRRGSLAEFRDRAGFDLVICYDVMQYLGDEEARRALANLGRLCRGALYFLAPTREDWAGNADLSCSDSEIHLRDGEWYRERLARSFQHAGFGLHVRDGVAYAQWELERGD
jgi:SAM-dependent methyltransferase